jgi:hypothetical protein
MPRQLPEPDDLDRHQQERAEIARALQRHGPAAAEALRPLAALVARMRTAQADFFNQRRRGAPALAELEQARHLEAEVDQTVAEILAAERQLQLELDPQ